jgi:hypothetical protein
MGTSAFTAEVWLKVRIKVYWNALGEKLPFIIDRTYQRRMMVQAMG